MHSHLIGGKYIEHLEFEFLNKAVYEGLCKSLKIEVLINACEKAIPQLIAHGYDQIIDAFKRSYIEEKKQRELGTLDPFTPKRFDPKRNLFECYKPLGVLTHIAAGNAPGLGALSVLEGLMSGTINILKPSSKDSSVLEIIKILIENDDSDSIKNYVHVVNIPSSNKEGLKEVFRISDAVVVWGGNEAVESVKKMTHQPVIAWGHRMSIAYFTQKGISQHRIDAVVRDICETEQLFCSSPQCIFVETETKDELDQFSQKIQETFERISPKYPLATKSLQEEGEITRGCIMAKLGESLENTKLIQAKDQSWRIFTSYNSTPEPSPLYRTIWIKPMKREHIIDCIHPLRGYMQTVSLNCELEELRELSEILVRSGATRIVPGGASQGGYPGEPHDGIYALTQYTRRITIYGSEKTQNLNSFCEM